MAAFVKHLTLLYVIIVNFNTYLCRNSHFVINEYGRTLPSDALRFTTDEEVPDSEPKEVIVEAKGPHSVLIKWKPPQENHWNGQLKGYYLGYRTIDNNDNNQWNDRDTISLYSFKYIPFDGVKSDHYYQEFELSGLMRSSTYGIIIKAFNSAGEGPASQEVIVTTHDYDPPARPSVWIGTVTETSVIIKWDQKEDYADITHYVLYYKDNQTPWMVMAFPTPVNSEYELNNLNRGTVYQIYIRAMSKRGPSDPSEVMTFRTEGEGAINNVVINQKGIISQQNVPPYLRSIVVIPFTIAIVIIVIACVAAYAYVKLEDPKMKLIHNMISSSSPSKNFQYFSTGTVSSGTTPHHSGRQSVVSEEGSLSIRYFDSSDRSRPLMARPPVPTVLWTHEPIIEESDVESSYATLPFQKFTSFKSPSTHMTPPQVPETRRITHDDRDILCHTPPNQSSNVFCKAVVHMNESHDSYDDLLKAKV